MSARVVARPIEPVAPSTNTRRRRGESLAVGKDWGSARRKMFVNNPVLKPTNFADGPPRISCDNPLNDRHGRKTDLRF